MSDATPSSSLSPAAHLTLRCVLDELIPASSDGRLPAAGALGLADHALALVARVPQAPSIVARGLASLDALAHSRGAECYAALPQPERLAALHELAAEGAFLEALLFPTYAAYYQHPRVLAALGLEARPPYPRGHELPPFDVTLLEPVLRRPRRGR